MANDYFGSISMSQSSTFFAVIKDHTSGGPDTNIPVEQRMPAANKSRKRKQKQHSTSKNSTVSGKKPKLEEQSSENVLRGESSLWKPVAVELTAGLGKSNAPLPDQTADGSEEADMQRKEDNHYDNPKLVKQASRDLPVKPGEEVAMFYGLEVLDSSHYQVVGSGSNRQFQVRSNGNETTNEFNSTEPEIGKQSDSGGAESETKKKKKKKKKSKESVEDVGEGDNLDRTLTTAKAPINESPAAEDQVVEPSMEETETIRQSWSHATGGAFLHSKLCKSLARAGFDNPTPIQAATLAASILGRRNLVGAAPTGSGKTLAFLLPILHELLTQCDDIDQGSSSSRKESALQALIVTPTRELASQIYKECEKLEKGRCASLVGGIAMVKQARILKTKRPPIAIGTPGRLWAMISSGEHEHLRDLSQVRFLVLDEADRMTQDHCFPQLIQILHELNRANPNEDEDDSESDDEDGSLDQDGGRLLGLPGIRGEAKLEMLTPEILQQINAQRNSTAGVNKETADEDFENSSKAESNSENEMAFDEAWNVDKEGNFENQEKVQRQTFIYSATLTLPYTSTKEVGRQKRRRRNGLEGGIAQILEKCHAMGETKVVDLSTSASSPRSGSNRQGVKLPPGLRLEEIKCTQRHKDSHLYAYLMTTSQGSAGPALVFCNSIAAVRRVGKTLQTLGLSVRILHANMQQRARFKAVESLNEGGDNRAVVVCTDVAARGLDIPSVSAVIHYDVARAVDTFVHRSGRTARGVGTGAQGCSLSLVSPAEDKSQTKIQSALVSTANFSKVLMDGRLMTQAQERVSLASKVVIASEIEQKMSAEKNWFLAKAKEADLELDDDIVEDENNMNEKDDAKLRDARNAKKRLSILLRTPMRTRRFGKFLATNSAARHQEIKPL